MFSRAYENQNLGTFLLYKNDVYNVQVSIRFNNLLHKTSVFQYSLKEHYTLSCYFQVNDILNKKETLHFQKEKLPYLTKANIFKFHVYLKIIRLIR